MRYCVLSRRLGEKEFGDAVRGHWGIENSPHGPLDMLFGEDACRVRRSLAVANINVARGAVLWLPKDEEAEKNGVKNKRFGTACNTSHTKKVLTRS